MPSPTWAGRTLCPIARRARACCSARFASPTERLHRRFYAALGYEPGWEDASNRLLDVETQLRWLRELGFEDVDCSWKWLEMALLIGVKPGSRG